MSKIFNKENAFALLAMLCGFLICAEYAIVRPVSNSLFIHVFGSSHFPYAWLATVPLSLLAVALYNHLLPRWGCSKLFFISIVTIVGINTTIALSFPFFPSLAFFFYIWKEVYIMLMFQQLWSVIHATMPLGRAKALYGIFFGVGGLGSIFGSSFPGFFAVAYGSETLLFMTIPLYLLLVICFTQLTRISAVATLPAEIEESKQTSWKSFSHGCELIGRSRFLLFVLIIVILMQLSSAILDFQFNDALGRLYPDKDLRTQFSARILAIGHFATVTLQFIGSYLLIRLLGVKKSHLTIPLILGCNCLLYAFFPLFSLLSFSFMAIKAFDFSIFGVLREMLYVPLKPDEKFRAKAVIDIFAYRAAKAGAAFLILAFQPLLTWLSILLCALWIGAVFWGLNERELQKRAL
jgi:AAA family ATP:ADP antiporter